MSSHLTTHGPRQGQGVPRRGTRNAERAEGRARFAIRKWLTVGSLLLAVSAPAQDTGSVTGVVVNTWDGAPLPLVAVSVRGTTLATQTDAAGRYQLNEVPPGVQVLRFSKSGFASAVVTDVRVIAGQTTTVAGNLRPEFYEMEEYEVTAEEFGEQKVEIMEERQQATTFLDAVGSDAFKNLAVSDAGQVLSKVTGASVADGKYAVIRGLADRYTFTTLNGMELPSADPDRKAFQLDLMPAKFIERVDVRKTFTPDMSGGFAGGSIDIVTRAFPEDFLFEYRISTAYNTQSSLRDDFAASDRSSTDWLAMDDGRRALPDEAAATSPSGSANLPPNARNSFKSSQIAPASTDSPLDFGTDLLVGFTREVFGKRLGVLGGFNYKNSYHYSDDGFIRTYQPQAGSSGPQGPLVDKVETLGVIEYQWGALANLALELNEFHEVSFNAIYIQAAEDEASRLQGLDGSNTDPQFGTYMDQSVLHWTERNLSYYQLSGGHEVPEMNGLRLDWAGVLSTTTQDEPDFRIFQFLADPRNSFYNPEISGAQPNNPTRYWRELTEDNSNVRVDLTLPLPSYNAGENALKGGVAISQSERDYSQRGFVMLRSGSFGLHPFYSVGDPNLWVAPENLQFINYRNFPVNLTYSGEQTVKAGYLMADWAVLDWLQLVGGARYESTELSINGRDLTRNLPLTSGRIEQRDILPSLSARIQIRENIDLRAAWSQTIVRPTYREIAAVPIYDVTRSVVYSGNPDLVISESENYDLRFSWYPGPGEIVSASVFAKRIKQPIEQSSTQNDDTQIGYDNFEKADVLGVEGEIRVGLDRLWKPLDPFTLGFNGAYIESEVPLTQIQRVNRQSFQDTSTSRPLYNQPKYILNGDLTWEIEPTKTTVALSGGVVGESLVLVGLARPDRFVQPAPELNLFLRQKLGSHWDVRLTARNLLNPEFQVAQTWPNGEKVVLESFTKGITFGISVGCEF